MIALTLPLIGVISALSVAAGIAIRFGGATLLDALLVVGPLSLILCAAVVLLARNKEPKP
jgi:hypothetical protein